MKKILLFLALAVFITALTGCAASQQLLIKDLNNTGYLFLNHYTSLVPTLGPCGFSRDQDMYDIKTPRIKGRIESTELVIDEIGSKVKNIYSGYIEFTQDNKVYVNLFKLTNGVKRKLNINGMHTIAVKDDMLGDKRV